MTPVEPADATDEIRIAGIETLSADWVQKVIELGDQNRHRLGPMPFSGFREAATNNNIVLAIRSREDGSESLAGYCLYAPTVRSDRYARIAHLCVADTARGQGVARDLIESVMTRCNDRLGLRLRCRDDWEAAAAWPTLGFEPVRGRTGRGKTKEPMTEWVRHNEAATHLFSPPSEDPSGLLAAVDSNVFCDLYGRSSTRRHRFSGTVALLAASGQIDLGRPFSVTAELNKTADKREREALLQTAAVSSLKTLNADRSAVQHLSRQLIGSVPERVLARDASLRDDAVLVAESILGGADVFVTRDSAVVTYLGAAAAEGRDFTVLHPDELPAFIDRRADVASYLPIRLEETGYQVTRGDAATWDPERLMGFLDLPSSERKVEFRALIRELATRSAGTDVRQAMLTPTGDVLAIWATRSNGEVLEVPLLRIRPGVLFATIARQISRSLRRTAASSRQTSVEVLDLHLPAAVAAELRQDGFNDQGPSARFRATVLTTVSTWQEVAADAARVTDSTGTFPSQIDSALEASEYERLLWPAKILVPELPTYIVPIRGVFADDLLGHVPTLLARPADLGLSREHIYYRSGQTRPRAPGRILWYSSARDKTIVACSRLVESVAGSPEVLHREFANIGVLSLEQVRSVKDGRGRVNALRFADTEIFRHPLSLARVHELSAGAARLTMQSPTEIDADMFARLYKEGTRP